MDNLILNSFLKMGYFLDYKSNVYDFDLSSVDKNKYNALDETELVEIGTRLIKETIEQYYKENTNNCIPLSGGLDSRAILAGLLECTSAENLDTFTFGTPGTLDFDIGCHIAKMFGTKHEIMPLNEHIFTLEELIDTSNCIDNQTVLFSTFPLYWLRDLYSNHIIWSGAFAGTTSGNVYMQNASNTIEGAKTNFINHGYTHVKSVKLTNCEDKELHKLLDIDFIDKSIVTFEEQLHLKYAQLKWIAPHLLIKGFEYRTPFIDKDWITFMLSIDNQYRINQYLYKKILLNAFPKAFSYITKSHYYGCPLNANKLYIFVHRSSYKIKNILMKNNKNYIKPSINYINFCEGIRYREDLKKIIYESINDLKDRKLVEWIDIDKIWNNHINCKGDFSDALLVLASLEIHLKAIYQKSNININ